MQNQSPCLLLFSGGRDSTLAALRLAETKNKLVLVTVTANFLYRFENVERRISEIAAFLPKGSEWIQVVQPTFPPIESIGQSTCLPCQRAYAVTGSVLAKQAGIDEIALGYTGYQSTWPEQTPQAIARLRNVLTKADQKLILPVYDLDKKEEALKELERHGISADALEQKCIRQVTNIEIPREKLDSELDKWAESLEMALKQLHSNSKQIIIKKTLTLI